MLSSCVVVDAFDGGSLLFVFCCCTCLLFGVLFRFVVVDVVCCLL